MLVSNCFNTITVVSQKNSTKNQVRVPALGTPMTIGGQPLVSTALSFKFDQKCSGTITINGSLNGTGKTEDVSISNNSICQSMTKFDQVDSLDFSSALTTLRPHLTVKYINMSGSSVPLTEDVISNYPINLLRSKAELIINTDGSVQSEIIKSLLPYTDQWTPKEFDLFTLDQTSETFIVVGKPIMQQVGINTHWICNLKRYERS